MLEPGCRVGVGDTSIFSRESFFHQEASGMLKPARHIYSEHSDRVEELGFSSPSTSTPQVYPAGNRSCSKKSEVTDSMS